MTEDLKTHAKTLRDILHENNMMFSFMGWGSGELQLTQKYIPEVVAEEEIQKLKFLNECNEKIALDAINKIDRAQKILDDLDVLIVFLDSQEQMTNRLKNITKRLRFTLCSEQSKEKKK